MLLKLTQTRQITLGKYVEMFVLATDLVQKGC